MQSNLPNTLPNEKNIFFLPATLALISIFIMVFIMGLLKIYSPDIGFHLKSAKWILDNKKFIYTDSFSYGAEGNNYYNLQWLYQLVVYALYNAGEKILVVVNALLITFSLILIWFRFTKYTQIDDRNMKLGLFAFMTLFLVQPLSFEIRPHVFSWIFLNLTLLFLESYKKGNKKSVYLLPVLMLLWVNCHSLSIIGLAVIGIYNLGNYLEEKKLDKKLLLFSIISFAAFLVNPYFIEGFFYPFKQFGIIAGNSLLKSYIGEFQSPFTANEIKTNGAYYFVSPLFIIHLSALLSLFSIYRAVISKEFTNAILLIAFFILLCLGHKNYGYFFIVSMPLLVKYLVEWIQSRTNKVGAQKTIQANKNSSNFLVNNVLQTSFKKYRNLSLSTIIIACIISITSITDGYQIFRKSPYRFGFTLDHENLPVDATNFLKVNKITGKLLNHLDFGGYLMYHLNEKVYIDGRLEIIPEDFFKKYYKSATEKNGFKKMLDEFNPDVVFFPYLKATSWWDYFISNKKTSGYKAVYFDGLSVIYLRTSAYPQFAELNEKDILASLNPKPVNNMNAYLESAKKPNRPMALLNGLWQKQSFSFSNQNKATYCFTNGFDSAGLNFSALGIENSTIHTPNIFKNLSIYFNEKKMYTETQLSEDKSE